MISKIYFILHKLYFILYTIIVESIYLEITIIICLAAGLSILFRLLKQPLILAYIVTGILLGPLRLFDLHHHLTLESLGQLGVTFLLFMLGLELKIRELKTIGLPALIIGTMQMWFTFVLGFFLAFFLGFGTLPSVYIGIALSFSSTILIVKSLSDRKDLNSLHGKLSIGILLMQDFFAVLTIIMLNGIKPGVDAGALLVNLGFIIGKAILLFGFVMFASIHIVPKIVHSLSRSQELLFLFSLAWVFALTGLVTSPLLGFSIEIGGFLAGLALANCAENFQIVARMKALRDFFITIFFVMVGMSMSFSNLSTTLMPTIVFFLFMLFGKPLLITLLVGLLGYKKRTSFLVGNNMGQISEFSFILMFLGNKLGYIESSMVTTILFVGILSFLTSSYVMKHSNELFKKLEPYLDKIEFGEAKQVKFSTSPLDEMKNHIIIVGGHQMGQRLLHELEEVKKDIVIVDFDPDIVRKLAKKHDNVLFGDIADPEIHERIHLDKAKIVISTVPDLEDNLLLLRSINHSNKKAKVVVMALENEDARILYSAGADYVVLPHVAGGKYLAKMIKDNNLENVEWHKKRDMAYIT